MNTILYGCIQTVISCYPQHLDIMKTYTHVYKCVCVDIDVMYIHFGFHLKFHKVDAHCFHSQNKMNMNLTNLHSSAFTECLCQACLRLGTHSGPSVKEHQCCERGRQVKWGRSR